MAGNVDSRTGQRDWGMGDPTRANEYLWASSPNPNYLICFINILNSRFVQPTADEHHGQICAMSRLHDADISGRRDSPRSANCRAEWDGRAGWWV